MRFRYALAAAGVAALASAGAHAAGCGAAFDQSYDTYLRVIDSLRPEKPGALRVFAVDGSEFTGGQALWMKGQARDIERACARGDTEGASQRLKPLQAFIDSRATHQ